MGEAVAESRNPEVLFGAIKVSEEAAAEADLRHRQAAERALALQSSSSALGSSTTTTAGSAGGESDTAPATAAEMLLAGGPGAVLRGGPEGRVRRGGRVEIKESICALPEIPAVVRAQLVAPGARTPLALVVAGHVDAGKSTLIGRMLYSMG